MVVLQSTVVDCLVVQKPQAMLLTERNAMNNKTQLVHNNQLNFVVMAHTNMFVTTDNNNNRLDVVS
jgi:hypothetical protein